MYIPKHFAENNVTTLHDFIREHPFATLVATTNDGLIANHIPLYLNSEGGERACLQGHIARSNPLWKSVVSESQVLTIFQGINSYIRPSWFPSKRVDGKVVPTWNYAAVHVKGKITYIHDPQWKLKLLDNLTASQEGGAEEPWSISDAPHDFIEKQLPAIVGFEISIEKMYGKFKLSQNQSAETRSGIAESLAELGHPMSKLIQFGDEKG